MILEQKIPSICSADEQRATPFVDTYDVISPPPHTNPIRPKFSDPNFSHLTPQGGKKSSKKKDQS